MPWCEVPPAALAHVGMFGYHVINDNPEFVILQHGNKGNCVVSKARPVLWFDDVGEAMQAGAISIIQVGP